MLYFIILLIANFVINYYFTDNVKLWFYVLPNLGIFEFFFKNSFLYIYFKKGCKEFKPVWLTGSGFNAYVPSFLKYAHAINWFYPTMILPNLCHFNSITKMSKLWLESRHFHFFNSLSLLSPNIITTTGLEPNQASILYSCRIMRWVHHGTCPNVGTSEIWWEY